MSRFLSYIFKIFGMLFSVIIGVCNGVDFLMTDSILLKCIKLVGFVLGCILFLIYFDEFKELTENSDTSQNPEDSAGNHD